MTDIQSNIKESFETEFAATLCDETASDSSGSEEVKLVKTLTSPTDEEIKSRTVLLGPATKKYTLVLDIDNTLLFAEVIDKEKETANGTEQEQELSVKIRPYALELLEQLHLIFEIVLFTAGCDQYATEIKKLLDPEQKYISRALGNSSCFLTKEGYYVKDLRIFADRKIDNIIIVDDLATSFALQPDNGVTVIPYTGETEDDELKLLIDYLWSMNGEDCLSRLNRERLQGIY